MAQTLYPRTNEERQLWTDDLRYLGRSFKVDGDKIILVDKQKKGKDKPAPRPKKKEDD